MPKKTKITLPGESTPTAIVDGYVLLNSKAESVFDGLVQIGFGARVRSLVYHTHKEAAAMCRKMNTAARDMGEDDHFNCIVREVTLTLKP